MSTGADEGAGGTNAVGVSSGEDEGEEGTNAEGVSSGVVGVPTGTGTNRGDIEGPGNPEGGTGTAIGELEGTDGKVGPVGPEGLVAAGDWVSTTGASTGAGTGTSTGAGGLDGTAASEISIDIDNERTLDSSIAAL